jgi:hypothetical protein
MSDFGEVPKGRGLETKCPLLRIPQDAQQRDNHLKSGLDQGEVQLSISKIIFIGERRHTMRTMLKIETALSAFHDRFLLQLLSQFLRDRAQGFDARKIFIIGFHQRPGRIGCARLHQHLFRSGDVILPFTAIAPILICDLPCFVIGPRAFTETAQLFLLADVHPEFKGDCAKVVELALKLIDLAIRAAPISLGAKPFQTFHQYAPIP